MVLSFDMNICISATRLGVMALALGWGAAAPTISTAQSSHVLREVVVTATRMEQPLVDLVADVSIIDRLQIDRSGATGMVDLLARQPGIEFSRNGGPGATTNLYVRGAESRFMAVFIDGVRVDSQSTGGATWEAIPLSQIDRVEVVRGPVSAVYGSDAMGGAIQIFTRKGETAFAPFAGVGVGTDGARRWEAGFSGLQGGVDYALGLAREASKGFNARTLPGYNTDEDGYTSESASAQLGWQIHHAHRLEFTALSSDNNSQYDATNVKPKSTLDDHSLHLLQTRGLSWRAQWSEQYSTVLRWTESRDQYETKPSVYLTMTRLNGYLWQNELRSGAHLLSAALERKLDYLENGLTTNPATAIVRERFQDALAVGYGWRGQQHTLQLNARHDQDSEFGAKVTGSAAYGYNLNAQWRASASAGTAFRVPTLFQRFGTSGQATLQPETSQNREFGIRFTQGTSSFGLIAYLNQVSNLITFVRNQGICANNTPPTVGSTPGCYFNTAQAEYAGITVTGKHRLAGVNLSGTFDVQALHDTLTGKFLPRRASQHANLGAETRLGAWNVGADLQLSGPRYDDAANLVALPGYALADVHVSRKLDKDWTLLARVDNLFDANYQLTNGYATPGRSLYLGLKWSPLQ
jgi:vitamin B12 transporter